MSRFVECGIIGQLRRGIWLLAGVVWLCAACVYPGDAPASVLVSADLLKNRTAQLLDFSGGAKTGFQLTSFLDGPVELDFQHTGGFLELFNVTFVKGGPEELRDLTIRWEGESTSGVRVTESFWEGSSIFTDRGRVEAATVSVGQGFYEVYLAFQSSIPSRLVQFEFVAVLSPRGLPFSMILQSNTRGHEIAQTPIPGALWLLLSAVGAALGLTRRTTAKSA